MDSYEEGRNASDITFPPGTVALKDMQHTSEGLILHPVPTDDPNDPLNWSKMRKAVNFGLVCMYVLITFVFLDIGTVSYSAYSVELGIDFNTMNNAAATNYVGLAIGCMLFIPLIHRYGRRPIYIASLIVQLASAIWSAKIQTGAEMIVCNLVSGLGGAVSETIVQVTIADLFFVHQHATFNGIFLLMQASGAYLGPVAAGYVTISQGWRWTWWWTAIFTGVNFVATIFFFEETKFVPTFMGIPGAGTETATTVDKTTTKDDTKYPLTNVDDRRSSVQIAPYIRPKSYRERLAFVTKTDTPIAHHYYQPFLVIVTIPAVAYVALTYGFLLSLFSVIVTTQSYYMILPPYNFDSASIGLLSLAPFIGSVIGAVIGGWMNDRLGIWCAKRNNGIFEPEMRLYIGIPGAFICVAGLLMYGLGLSYLQHWAVLAVGFGIYGFGFMISGDVALTYLTDSYLDIISDSFVIVAFFRNAFSTIILYTLTPWLDGMGLRDTFILIACLTMVILLLPVPLIFWGKQARIKTAEKYRNFSSRQPVVRGE